MGGLSCSRPRRPTIASRATESSPTTQPPAADVVLRFVNTRSGGPHQLPERFGTAEELHAWLVEQAMASESAMSRRPTRQAPANCVKR
ncbi:ABATE domain-containing protein [Streptomyces chromofuscus]|uniref:ABATE domain-containing protein n=1 Tax=Streptomyces chromofuscus TaxID=42881 RepID=UPI003571215D